MRTRCRNLRSKALKRNPESETCFSVIHLVAKCPMTQAPAHGGGCTPRCDDYIALRQLQHRRRPDLRRLLLRHSAARTAPSLRLLRSGPVCRRRGTDSSCSGSAPVQCVDGGAPSRPALAHAPSAATSSLRCLRPRLPAAAALLALASAVAHPVSRRRTSTRPALAPAPSTATSCAATSSHLLRTPRADGFELWLRRQRSDGRDGNIVMLACGSSGCAPSFSSSGDWSRLRSGQH